MALLASVALTAVLVQTMKGYVTITNSGPVPRLVCTAHRRALTLLAMLAMFAIFVQALSPVKYRRLGHHGVYTSSSTIVLSTAGAGGHVLYRFGGGVVAGSCRYRT